MTALRGEFSARYGSEPDVVAVAPGRVNLIGEHVDYNGGRCLPMAIEQATYAAVRLRSDTTVTLASRQAPEPWTGDLTTLGPEDRERLGGRMPPAWCGRCASAGIDVPGLDVLVDGRVPLGAGLSSSAALECAVALAVSTALGRSDTEQERRALIADCIRAERDVAGALQAAWTRRSRCWGNAGHALLLDCATGETPRMSRGDPRAPDWCSSSSIPAPSHALVDGGYAERRARARRPRPGSG